MSDCSTEAMKPKAMPESKPQERWHTSEDGECYFWDAYPSMEEAIEAGRRDYSGSFYVGREAAFWPSVDEEHVIDQVTEQAWDYADDYSDDWLRNLSNDETTLLRDKLQAAFDEWMHETNNEPRFFMVEFSRLIDPNEEG